MSGALAESRLFARNIRDFFIARLIQLRNDRGLTLALIVRPGRFGDGPRNDAAHPGVELPDSPLLPSLELSDIADVCDSAVHFAMP